MKKSLIISGLVLGALVLGSKRSSASPRKPSLFLPIRNDPMGSGHFGASRGSRIHKGIDLLVTEGQTILSPISGTVSRVAYPYTDKSYRGIEIIGSGEHKGYKVKIFYMNPVSPGTLVKRGSPIGTAQAISKRYGSSMKDHIHVELYRNGIAIDPQILYR